LAIKHKISEFQTHSIFQIFLTSPV